MIHGLDETILHGADNLFLLRIPFEDDVRHVSRGAATDYETMAAFVRRLRQHHALVIGNVTAQYPLIFRVDRLAGINTAGETRFFFQRSDIPQNKVTMKNLRGAAEYTVEWLQEEHKSQKEYIKPSSLAKGCMLYVAFELQGKPKPPFDARVGRILSVGTDSHRRLQRAMSRACLAQEVFFEMPEYRIHGFLAGRILYIPPGVNVDRGLPPPASGRWNTKPARPVRKLTKSKLPKSREGRTRASGSNLPVGIEKYYQGSCPAQRRYHLLRKPRYSTTPRLRSLSRPGHDGRPAGSDQAHALLKWTSYRKTMCCRRITGPTVTAPVGYLRARKAGHRVAEVPANNCLTGHGRYDCQAHRGQEGGRENDLQAESGRPAVAAGPGARVGLGVTVLQHCA